MIAALVLAVACVPDLVAYSRTPVVTWDRPPCLDAVSIACWREPVPPDEDCAPGCYADGVRPDGYVLRWQRPGVAFDDQRRLVLPCSTAYDEAGAAVGRFCPGRDLGYPVQRFNSSELEVIDYVVSAYAGTPTVAHEGGRSNVVAICMPEWWHGRGTPYR